MEANWANQRYANLLLTDYTVISSFRFAHAIFVKMPRLGLVLALLPICAYCSGPVKDLLKYYYSQPSSVIEFSCNKRGKEVHFQLLAGLLKFCCFQNL